MNEKLIEYKNKTIEFWKGRTKRQRGLFIASIILFLLVLLTFMWFGSRTNYAPLYTNLTVQEAGEIKGTLDTRGISYKLANGGTTILVSEESVDDLKLSLAAEGIPKTGRIDYGTFRDNMGFGTTDNEFNLLERAAIETNIEDLMRNIDGINYAYVNITMPEESIWIIDKPNEATASVLLNISPGFTLDQSQIKALYHLVSRSVPNLPVENITMIDQMSRYLELHDEDLEVDTTLTIYEQQRRIKKDIEKDIQRQVQQMLGTLVGHDKVLVTVSTDIDFTKENRQESLVTPVDDETMSGINISVERITETYSGNELPEGGIPGTGETDIPGYPGIVGSGGVGEYERIEERINDEVNRIQREIVESPYKIRDIGIQVLLEPPVPEDPLSLPAERLNDVQQILGQIVRTSIDHEYTLNWEQSDIEQRIYVAAQPFYGKTELPVGEEGIPYWYYIIGGLILLIIALILLLLRKRKKGDELILGETGGQIASTLEIPDIEEKDTEEKIRKRQLEKLAKEKPEEFSKLVRTWLSED